MAAVRRSKRQRVAVDYARLDESGFEDCARVQYRKLARAVLKWPQGEERAVGQVGGADEQQQLKPCAVPVLEPERLSEYVHSTGFQNPCVVRASEKIGLRLPDSELTVEDLAKLVGHDRQVETIDVSTQTEGPVYTMEEWVSYFSSPGTKKPLLNVVSLDLANTPLQKMVTPPSLVKELDLVEKAWPRSSQSSSTPEVQLYAIMSVAGCYMDFHLDFGGSSVWYHVISGRKAFLMVPPTNGNLMLFEEWASSDRQASVFFADRASGGQKVELSAGDTLLLPGGWPHCVVTHTDSIVIGGNFLTGYNLGVQLDVWLMEERLKVRQKFRFPFYKQLMWYTAACYLKLLNEEEGEEQKVTSWERDGLPGLVRCLNLWLQSKDGGETPHEISRPASLLVELKDCLEKRYGIEGIPSPARMEPLKKAESDPDEDDEEQGMEQLKDVDDDDFDVNKDADGTSESEEEFSESDEDRPQARPPKSSSKKEAAKHSAKPPPPAAKKANPKANSTVRERLLKKIGIDPRVGMPSRKQRQKPATQ